MTGSGVTDKKNILIVNIINNLNVQIKSNEKYI